MENILSETIKKGYDYITNKNQTPTLNIQILEPLSVIIKLATVSLYPIGTKIAVYNNKLRIHSPTIFQGTIRWSCGSTRGDIHLLLNPITKALYNYSPYIHTKYKHLFESAIKGLEKLKQSYNDESSILSHALDYYIHIIEASFETSIENVRDVNKNIHSLDNIFIDLWTDVDIDIISNMFSIINDNVDNTNDYIIAINAMLSTKRIQIKEIIKDTNKFI